MKKLSTLLVFFVFQVGCGSPPAKNIATPTPAASTSIPASPERIDKATNVSFSTYSKEWPVGWQWIDPAEKYAPTPHDIKSGVLKVKILTKKDLYGDNRTAPRYMKAIAGDFQIETRVKFLPKENYQGAGLLIYWDDNNYIRFERAYGGIGGGGEGLRIDVRKPDAYTPIVTPGDLLTGADQVDLRIVRIGRVFTCYWRLDENAEWRDVGEFESDYPETILAGIVAVNTAREITVEFAYIKLLPSTAK
jgi:regulation of enolase protein 1 (concanavalin A-like superfamily)